MSQRPIVLDPDIQSLQDDGLSVEVVQGHLLVHQVPYVNANGKVARGIMVTDLPGNVGALGKPRDHQIWFVGETPCYTNGKPIRSLNRTEGRRDLWHGFAVDHRFSCKPTGQPDFPLTHSDKIRHYLALIAPEAKAVEPEATPYLFEPVVSFDPESVFKYWDYASTRAGILAVTAKLEQSRVAIVGLGGTGSYVLDLVAKTPVRELHLFDGDQFEQHSAFRTPGAASIKDIDAKMPKVEYFASIYARMRKGIHPHPVYVEEANLSELDNFDFVFLCVDKGGVRRMLGEYLIARDIPFVDTGMELTMLPEANALLGTCRATLCTAGKSDHFSRCAPQSDALGDDLYRSNIQVADMNMLNAVLAVHLWKKHCTFYLDHWQPHHHTYSIDSASLTRSEALNLPLHEDQADQT
ncbi:MAG: ThiF family adenylyltransferase [Gammaproteobacteria bacterium]|nr:ThiF family adenylyltransferase [Rhodocyclaceae bacterium]MBU3907728.1 ThiF family adenylyltransferase [Gammaproteobacteria bacterium]MBU3989840.1 ThiF family adenylyltransferase [Gammaproteobacteria bacterium]MBU4004374.1 ThiF family adenylyltransferase [Gammaproteobacteria bacterium]MBU4019783.1 ThiF family adenylyltransferase [Gammaproteobacteria bacterium]